MTLSAELINKLKTCRTDKELKKEFKKIASQKPDKYFPTKELHELGYIRKHCSCGTHFWTVHEDRDVCGDPMCSGGFNVVIDNPSEVKLSFIQVWEKIVEILEPRGYKPIKRYPCVARWNPTVEFTIASISAFQPYVITGDVEPPAKKLIIPQFCLRFNDVENVGVTSSHCTGFIMIGQHSFVSPEEWNQGQLFMDMHDFIHKGVGLAKEEITIHEDSWAGGGSFGCSLEFFSRGVELFNQVYTMFEQTPDGPRELKLKVLDMGLGQERVAWFSQGTPNMYEAIFPLVLKRLRERTQIDLDLDLYNRFSKYSAYLNVDEVEDIDAAWTEVAAKLNLDVATLRETIMPMTALYSIAEHSRSLLFAINDGKLPSNVGGGYNLRAIFRRAISFIDNFDWDIDIADVCEWHAEELYELFPEVSEHLDEIREILDIEKQKFYATKRKAGKILKKMFEEDQEITVDTMIELYDSRGISPDMIKKAAQQYGRTIKIPDDFYGMVVDRHEKAEQIHATGRAVDLDFDDLPETESLYYYDYTETSNEAEVLKIKDHMVIVDKSVAYPTSGGQLHDVGTINGQRFSDVFKQGGYIVHVLDDLPQFKEGDTVTIKVDDEWRRQLSQHHTATHIVNAAARDVLGSHVNQAGAKKTLKNSHLDITHYEQIPREQLLRIENRANEIVDQGIDLNLQFLPRTDAEQQYGMEIYQGGAVPGKKIRIVQVPGVDVEACGGTHLNNTAETGQIKIIKSQKIQDGVVRLKFTAGKATKKLEKKHEDIIEELKSILKVDESYLPGRVEELLNKRNNLFKALKKGKVNEKDLSLTSSEASEKDVLAEISQFLNTKKSLIPNKVEKLYGEWSTAKGKLDEMKRLLSDEYLGELVEKAADYQGFKFLLKEFEEIAQNDVKNLGIKLLKEYTDVFFVFLNRSKKGITVMGMTGEEVAEGLDLNMGAFIKDIVLNFGGKGGGNKEFGQGFIPDAGLTIDEISEFIDSKLKA